MPVKIFYVQGNKPIGELESEIIKWQKSLGPKASVTHISTAMTEHEDTLLQQCDPYRMGPLL